jgi:hypothetical protein
VNRREHEIYQAIDTYLRVHQRWVGLGESAVHITGEYADAVELLFDIWSQGGVPELFRGETELAVAKLRTAWHEFDTSGEPLPGHEFWSARELLEKSIAPEVPEVDFYLETIEDLDKQKVSHEQIARMYGLVDSQGRGLAHLIDKELKEPGSVIGSDWEHPELKRRREEAERVANRIEELRKGLEESEMVEPAKLAYGDRNCPETVEELCITAVPVPQAAKMLGWQEDVVQESYDMIGDRQNAASPMSEGAGPLEDMTYHDLKRMAKECGIATTKRTKKAELIEMLTPGAQVNGAMELAR